MSSIVRTKLKNKLKYVVGGEFSNLRFACVSLNEAVDTSLGYSTYVCTPYFFRPQHFFRFPKAIDSSVLACTTWYTRGMHTCTHTFGFVCFALCVIHDMIPHTFVFCVASVCVRVDLRYSRHRALAHSCVVMLCYLTLSLILLFFQVHARDTAPCFLRVLDRGGTGESCIYSLFSVALRQQRPPQGGESCCCRQLLQQTKQKQSSRQLTAVLQPQDTSRLAE